MNAVLEKTTREDQRIASISVGKTRQPSGKSVSRSKSPVSIKLVEGKKTFEIQIPGKAYRLLIVILENMAEGKSVTVLPSDSLLSTQAAAEMLNISRPHLVKLLEEGEIPFIKTGAHRRVELSDLLKYDKSLKEKRNNNLAFLAKQAQELNLGY